MCPLSETSVRFSPFRAFPLIREPILIFKKLVDWQRAI